MEQHNGRHFGQYNYNQGLSNNQVGDILQDSSGFLWIATYEGLNRFDGFEFKVYRAQDESNSGLSANYTTSLVEDDQANLWIGTAQGVTRLSLETYQFTLFNFDKVGKQSDVFVNRLHLDQQQRLWVASNQGIFRFNRQQQVFERVELPAPFNTLNIHQISSDALGHIWALVDQHGIFLLDQDKGIFDNLAKLMPKATFLDDIRSLWFDQNQQLWLGNSTGKVQIVDFKGQTVRSLALPVNTENERFAAPVRAFANDDKGNIWITTMGKGIYIYHPTAQTLSHFYRSAELTFSLKDNYIWTVYKDAQGRMWLATDIAGVLFYDDHSQWFGHYFHDPQNKQSINAGSVWSMFQTRSGQYWIGHDQGVDLLDNNRQRILTLSHDPDDKTSLSDNRIFDIAEDKQGDIWFSSDNGLNRYTPQTGNIRHYFHQPGNPSSLPSSSLYVLLIDSQEQLWISSHTGLARYRPQTDDFLRFEKTMAAEIYDILEATPDHFWLASHQLGVLNFDAATGHVIRYRHDPKNPNSLSSNKTTSLILQRQYLWVATLNGLNRLSIVSGEIKRFRMPQGLPSNIIYRILPDNQGKIWGSTSKGLFSIDPKTENINTYGMKHGLQGNDFTSFGAYRTPSGELFFGGSDGFNSLMPQSIGQRKPPKPAILSELRVLNNPIEPGINALISKPLHNTQKLVLPHYQNLFSMAFSSLEYTDPRDLEYNYKLEGFHDDWLSVVPGKPQATFTNLDPGRYRFITRTRQGSGLWTQSPQGLEIKVLSPPWATWWAYFLYILIGASIFTSLYWQSWQKKRQHKTYLENLERRKKQLDMALWGSGDELWEWDIMARKMTRFNCLQHSVDRYFPGEFHLEKLAQYIHPEDAQRIVDEINNHLQGSSEFYEASYRIKSRDKGWIWVLDRGQVVEKKPNGQPLRFSGTTQNIDKLKQVEDQLRTLTQELEQRVTQRTNDLQSSTHQLQKSNTELKDTLRALKLTQRQLNETEKMAALGNLVVGVSHEINTPLGVSITALSLLKEVSDKLFDEKKQGSLSATSFDQFEATAQDCFALLSSNLSKTSQLVEHFKQVAVNQSDELSHEFNLACLLKDSTITATAKFSTVTFGMDLNCEYDIYMCSYPQTLSHVIIQLVENSFEHRPQKSQFVEIHLAASVEKDQLKIEYSDNGQGIDIEAQKRMFEPFYTTARGKGKTGLGMHIVYNQVTQRLGGTIKYSPDANGGARFIMRLPQRVPEIDGQ